MDRPEVLIEKYLPVEAIGAECLRERGASSALPPLYFLHVWWARRPLTVCRAALLASVLPADTDEKWFLETLGILGDPVKTRERIEQARTTGENLGANVYGYPRAFTCQPGEKRRHEIGQRIARGWGSEHLTVLDCFAGGGSIPFEALRFGFKTEAGELNPVAATILKATLDYPFRFGSALLDELEQFGRRWSAAVASELAPYFPLEPREEILAYIWARTVRCPDCRLVVPLSPNWWVDKTVKPPIAVRMIVPAKPAEHVSFSIEPVKRGAGWDPSAGTVRRGSAECPRCGAGVDNAHIKREAQAGRMGQQMYAVATRTNGHRAYRPPSPADLEAAAHAEQRWAAEREEWARKGWVPAQDIPYGHETHERWPLDDYGVTRWEHMFSPRQLLSLATAVKHLQTLKPEIRAALPKERADAVITLLAFAFDKSADYNSRMTRWHSGRAVLTNTFDRHDFAFKWSHGEMAVIREGGGFNWAIENVIDAYRGICRLVETDHNHPLFPRNPHAVEIPLDLRTASAADLSHLADRSVGLAVIDPPYYDNVQYAELSNFFYVWERLQLADVYAGYYADDTVDKSDETVANRSRFPSGKTAIAREQARRDYESKMQAAFREIRRVLNLRGVLTIMFTHREVEAWDTLATALIRAGFEITASWPVHTESDHSLHQARKNSCKSTVLLACRPRSGDGKGVWWDDIIGEVRQEARKKIRELESAGLRGVDLQISTFGPTLKILSQNWPVRDPQGELLKPDRALDVAREEVKSFRFRQLHAGREVRFDAATEYTIMAWDQFQATQFPYDEAMKLARVVGIDLEGELKGRMALLEKKGASVRFLDPAERRAKKPSQVDPDQDTFDVLVNAIHTAALVYQEDGPAVLQRFFRRTNLPLRPDFLVAVEDLLRVIPQRKATEAHFRPLYDLALATLEGKIKLPQLELFSDEDSEEEEDEE